MLVRSLFRFARGASFQLAGLTSARRIFKTASWKLALLPALAFSSCATRPHTYAAPSAAKMEASSRRLSTAVEKADGASARAAAHVLAAQASVLKIAAASAEISAQVVRLEKEVPPELAPKVADLRQKVDAQSAETKTLGGRLDAARQEQSSLTIDLADARAARDEFQTNSAQYQSEAQTLAATATSERNARIAAEKQLTSQKIFGWLWKIGGGLVVMLVVGLVVLWWTGKLALKLAV